MMNLTKHIAKLLLTEDIVAVPELGCFVVREMPAHYDAQEKVFFPATRTLGFTTKVTVDDFLLVQSYVDTYDLSLPDAVKEVTREVEEVKATLFNTGKFNFEGVGELHYNNNEYDFKPAFSSLLTPYLYGLDTIEMSTLAPQPVVITIQRSTIRKCASAAAVLAIALLSVVPVKHASESLHNMQTASVFSVATPKPAAKQETAVVKETIVVKETAVKNAETVSKKAETTTKKTETVKKEPAAKQEETPATTPEEQSGRYTIVLASGVTPSSAAIYADILRKEGLDVILTTGKKPEVLFGRYATSYEAVKELEKHADNPRFKMAWVKNL